MKKHQNLRTAFFLLPVTILLVCFGSCSKQIQKEIDLSGQWRFMIDTADVGIEQSWFKTELTESIDLPGSMPQRGKGIKADRNTKFTGNIWKEYEAGKTWMDDENYKPYLKENEFLFPFWLISDYYYTGAAWYQKEVEIPEGWINQQVELVLERCHWETRLWVNEQFVGKQDGLGVPHRYALESALQPGKNRITICVDNRIKEIHVGDDAHSVSDNTQSNWNGIVGEIKLVRKALVAVSNVRIYPDVVNKAVRLEIELKNRAGGAESGTIKIKAISTSAESPQRIPEYKTSFKTDSSSDLINVEYPMGDEVRLWDEFDPDLYELTVELVSESGKDEWKGTFGMRDFHVEGLSFVNNGRPVFLRGTLECAIFPKTGYPPTDVASWERIIHICKAHGLNHIRFHSWCPPEAAFEAADNLGFYYQVEVSAWASVGDGAPIDRWIYEESERMVAEYGNHPSFCLMPYGNEPSGENHPAYLKDFVKYWKDKDTRRVYTTGAGWPIIPENDYHSTHRKMRIQGWGQNLNSIINSEPPRSDYDWEEAIAHLHAPMVSHEIGQWCVYPNLKEVTKYDGVLKATNFEIFRRSLDAHGMLHLADSFLLASGKLQALSYKADIEAALRTKGFGGFQLLDLHDFPGQGSAIVGILDPFWEEKGYISPQEFKRFCNETVALARFEKMILTDRDTIKADIEVAHYGKNQIAGCEPFWTIRNQSGNVVREGPFSRRDIDWGNCQKIGTISEKIAVEAASKFTLEVDVSGYVNTWDFWVYPFQLPEIKSDVMVASALNAEVLNVLKNGGKVLLSIKKGQVKEGKGGEVAVGFSPIFWNTAWTNGQQPHTLGILCNPAHSALKHFPTEYHANWQWWDAMSHSNAISLEGFNERPDPIVRIIDDWVTNRNLALIFEVKVGEGKLLICGADLQSDMHNRPEARQLLYSLTAYLSGENFNPKTSASLSEVLDLLN
jgi:hypothetical protein